MKHTGTMAEPGAQTPAPMFCIRVGPKLDAGNAPALAHLLDIFGRRFGGRITLGLEGLSPLGEALLAQWLAQGLVEQMICSGHEDLILNDLLDAAIRSSAPAAVFVDAGDLLQSFAQALRFVVEHLEVASECAISANGRLLQCTVSRLPGIARDGLAGNWLAGLGALHAAAQTPPDAAPGAAPSACTAQAPRHLFVTRAGLERLGGVARFRGLPIHLGGASVSSYAGLTVLDGSGAAVAGDNVQHMAAIHDGKGHDDAVIFDIWPASGGYRLLEEPAGEHIQAPRQILVGRRCPLPASDLRKPEDLQAVFAMSNYNKGDCIQAALYGLVMQAHPQVALQIIDDISDDESMDRIRDFQRLTGLPEMQLCLEVNDVKRGTYWIRNQVIARHLQDDAVFFINDSDDVSTALRTTLQLAALRQNGESDACLFNIVRVDTRYAPLPLNDEVERYGTASLCFQAGLVRKAGYFQNLRRNADTEFIRRVRHFFGDQALPWLKFPVMFQRFDGNNLTADIYRLEPDGRMSASLAARQRHIEIADAHHARLDADELTQVFRFPETDLPSEYHELGEEFLFNLDEK